MIETGMIHGRFQPFHNGHFNYLQKALGHVDNLIVGITNPDPGYTKEVGSDSHRHLSYANPFSYFLRMRMIQNSILLHDKIRTRYSDILVTPFPINMPEHWKYYIPMDNVVQFMNILDPWDKEKKELFQKHGFEVFELNGERDVSGTEVRQAIHSGNKAWQKKVPLGTLKVLESWLQKGRRSP